MQLSRGEPDLRELQQLFTRCHRNIWASHIPPAVIIWSTITCDFWSQVWGEPTRTFRQGGRYALFLHPREYSNMQICKYANMQICKHPQGTGSGQNSRGQDKGCRGHSTRTIALRHRHRYWRVAP